MATTVSFYTQALKRLINTDLDTAGFTLHLVTSSYTPSAAHTNYDTEVGPYEVADSGYDPQALANVSIGNNSIDADDTTFPTLSATFRYAVLRMTTTAESPDEDLICWYLIDDSPADVTVAGTDYVFQWNASGLFTLTRTDA